MWLGLLFLFLATTSLVLGWGLGGGLTAAISVVVAVVGVGSVPTTFVLSPPLAVTGSSRSVQKRSKNFLQKGHDVGLLGRNKGYNKITSRWGPAASSRRRKVTKGDKEVV
jgi:hypothetical protein